MFESTCSFTKNDPLCMAYHPYHFVGEVLLHPVESLCKCAARQSCPVNVRETATASYLGESGTAFRIAHGLLLHPNIECLNWFLWKAGADFPVDVLRNSTDEWPQRHKDCLHANGGNFE